MKGRWEVAKAWKKERGGLKAGKKDIAKTLGR